MQLKKIHLLCIVKKLVIIRHAKSSWDNPLIDDFDRPLNERGKSDAPIMAKRLKDHKLKLSPDLILSSPAKRAKSTAKKFAKVFDIDTKKIIKEPKLYHASEMVLLKFVKEIPENANVVFIFGHNPGLTFFIEYISDLELDNLPTCGVVAFELKDWKRIGKEKAKVLLYDFPKNNN